MAFDNTNKGVMFKNDKTNDAQPDYRGSANIDGVEMWASGWIKVAGPNAKNPSKRQSRSLTWSTIWTTIYLLATV